MSMRGSRESRPGAPNSSDLLVCFPSRAHLTLMPKTICSPARPCEPSKRHGHNHGLSLSNYNKSKSRTRTRGGHGSPVLWAKTKSRMGQEMEMEEPTSPKVTCAGQIRVRPKSACKNWQSVMEEIERIHKKGRQKKKPSWMEALGLKKDVMHFLTCLRTLRFDFSCFGSLPAGAHDITSDDEDDDDEEEEEEEDDHAGDGGAEDEESSRTVFSKWFMVLQEEKEKEKIKDDDDDDDDDEVEGEEEACVPPPNALLLMRCMSAPAKSWLEEKAEEEEDDEKKYEQEEKGKEYKEKEKENSVLMRYDTEYYKISSDIAKETWVVGGMGDVLARSRSCKR